MTITASFFLFMAGFLVVGLLSYLKSRGTASDYYLASSSVPPWLVGLSAVATNNSGYMFIGVIGYTYVAGLSALWLMFGWISGDLIASLLVHRRLREATGDTGAVSYAGLLAGWDGADRPLLRRSIALLSLLFLTTYAAAQLLAGSKALQVLLAWPHYAGALMGAALVVIYCLAGGIRASIWTDAAQSIVMMVAMALLLWVATDAVGGPAGAWQAMGAVEGFTDWVPADLAFPGLAGGIAFAVSWLFAGLSVMGQPHVMVRFMTLQRADQLVRVRVWYYLWFLLFYGAATGVGLLSRVLLADPASFDAELALPMMAQALLPAPLVGLILAGIFAATISTADSLVLACSATLTHDLMPSPKKQQWHLRGATFAVTLLALALALGFNQSVFSLVIFSWSTLASAFAPLLLLWVWGQRPGQTQALLTLFGGVLAALAWRYLGLHDTLYEGMVGILTGLLVFALTQGWESRRRAVSC